MNTPRPRVAGRQAGRYGAGALILLLLLGGGGSAAPDEIQRDQFLKMFARSYFPGRSGQIMVVPRRGDVITSDEPTYRFMHGSPWDYDARIPLLFWGDRWIRAGRYDHPAAHQDIAPTLASILRLHPLQTFTGQKVPALLGSGHSPPRLAVVLILDAFRPDYLERFAEQLPHLRRLRDTGAWFPEARVNYLPTATAVAHGTIATGADPRLHGINLNAHYNRNTGKTQDPFPKQSPHNLMTLNLADAWTQATGGRGLVASLGGAFYAAAALGGHGACLLNGRPVLVASYDGASGGWISNPDCYSLPESLKEMRLTHLLQPGGTPWLGRSLRSADEAKRSALFSRFEWESLTRILDQESFGTDDVPDLMFANLKATDFVAHEFGPFSPETRATLEELDRQLGVFLSHLESKVGRGNYLLVVTADHGMPEEPGPSARRIFAEDIMDRLHSRFDPEQKLIGAYQSSDSQIHVNQERLSTLGLTLSQLARFLEEESLVFAAFTEEEVRAAQAAPQSER